MLSIYYGWVSLKIIIICKNFKIENFSRQPWRYIYDIAKYLKKCGDDVIIVSNTDSAWIDNQKTIDKYPDIFIRFTNKNIWSDIEKLNPDIIVEVVGPLSILTKRRISLETPYIGLLTWPLYSLKEVLSVGIREFVIHPTFVGPHFFGSIIPNGLKKIGFSRFDYIFVLSEFNKQRLAGYYLQHKIKILPLAIDADIIRKKVNKEIGSSNEILYFTSPLTLRGSDTVIRAFGMLDDKIDTKLVMLLRMESNELFKEVDYLKSLVKKHVKNKEVIFITNDISFSDLINYVARVRMVCIPFKIVISEIPVSILEAQSLEVPVISTNVACIPEMLDGKGLTINPGDVHDLANKMTRLLTENEIRNRFIKNMSKSIKQISTITEMCQNFRSSIIIIIDTHECK